MNSYAAIGELCAALDAELGADGDFDLDLGDMIGKRRARHHRAMQDAEAARLLPLGPSIAAERLNVCRASVYNMARRFRTKSKHPVTA